MQGVGRLLPTASRGRLRLLRRLKMRWRSLGACAERSRRRWCDIAGERGPPPDLGIVQKPVIAGTGTHGPVSFFVCRAVKGSSSFRPV